MAELKTPLSLRTRAGYGLAMIVDADGVCVCEGTLSDMQAVVAVVNRDAEHPETVRKLLDILRGLLRWHDGGEPAEWTQQQSVDDLHKHLAAARAAIAAAEGGGA